MLRRTFLAAPTVAFSSLAMGQSAITPAALSGEAPQLKVGDTWRWVRVDRRTGLEEAQTERVITKVTPDRIEATDNKAPLWMSGDLMLMETADFVRQGAPRFSDFPLTLGKKWSFKYSQASKTGPQRTRWQYDAEVVALERVKVPAGEFDTFKVVCKGYWNSETGSGNGSALLASWYAPAARVGVKGEFQGGNSYNATELVELRLAS